MKDTLFIGGALKPVNVEVIAREERRLCAELSTLGEETTLQEVGQKTREWLGKVSELLLAHSVGQGAISPELAHNLWLIVSQLAVGSVHRAIAYAAAGAGRRPEVPLERLDKQAAVDYVALARAGRISAADPVGDMAKAYNVARRTVQGWVKSIQAAPNINDAPPEFVINRALSGARRFRVGGRSEAAIRLRDFKRRSRK